MSFSIIFNTYSISEPHTKIISRFVGVWYRQNTWKDIFYQMEKLCYERYYWKEFNIYSSSLYILRLSAVLEKGGGSLGDAVTINAVITRFSKKNGWCCRKEWDMKRTDMTKIAKEALYHCYSSGKTFVQFDVSFLLIETFTYYSPPPAVWWYSNPSPFMFILSSWLLLTHYNYIIRYN